MFIDYVPLMVVNMAAGLVLLACYILWGLDRENGSRWAVPFGMVGLVAFVCGLHVIFTWPLPEVYNITHGETSVLFGVIYLGAALSLAKGWDLQFIAVYAFFAGLTSLVIGAGILFIPLTMSPVISASGYILTGLAAVLSAPALFYRQSIRWKIPAVVVLLIAAALWAFIGYGAYWQHLKFFKKWTPVTMQQKVSEQQQKK